jgi:hypothetical protein
MVNEVDPFCSKCGAKVGQAVEAEKRGSLSSTLEEEQIVRPKTKLEQLTRWVLILAELGGVSAVLGMVLTVVGTYQQNDRGRVTNWVNGHGGLPPGATIAGIVLDCVSTLFLFAAIAVGVYALRFLKKE